MISLLIYDDKIYVVNCGPLPICLSIRYFLFIDK